MSTKDRDKFARFVAYSDIRGLGEGDVDAGCNVLAAAACTIANLAPPGSAIQSPDGRRVSVGHSLLVNGSFSTSLAKDHVSSTITSMQNNLISHIQKTQAKIEEHEAHSGPKPPRMPDGPPASVSECIFENLHRTESDEFLSSAHAWVDVLAAPPSIKLRDIIRSHRIVITAESARSLGKQLTGLHSNRALVIMRLNGKSGGNKHGELCKALIDGTHPHHTSGGIINGNLLVLDPDNMLEKLAQATKANDIAWLGQMLWLVDDATGPDVDLKPHKDTEPAKDMHRRINLALHYAMGERLNNYQISPTILELDVTAAQRRWIRFLKGMATELPGISGSCRNLLATLVYGIHRITHTPHSCGIKSLNIPVVYIELFARHLIRRMANARNAIYRDAAAEKRLYYKSNILARLRGQDLSSREIYRSMGISAAQCRDLMHELAENKRVLQSGKKWSLNPGFKPASCDSLATQLEV